ncbi:septum formation protein Maf [Mobilitalea sibirica]|uniref:dTTP/UTP pyrophosphatase n=1 Tax=Mobilitalea sibirica TaxID=1462919 RepID=A0A8J7H393_9FIRM|nr:Maf family protein [Mobilitalea sibirica]MBH1941265.1 septum formation protein Maf [Mobilitalea sibirica]
MFRIILASESPRRKEIMETMGIPFEAMASNVEEVVRETLPEEMVQALAKLKSVNIAERIGHSDEDSIIIGADTMVFYQGHALGKPKDRADAIRILEMIADDSHEVYTGVSIIIRRKGYKERIISFAVCTKVTVQPLTRQQIEDYVATGEPMDKAGAYGIQGSFGIFIQGIEGDYYNVVGFPIAKIYEELLHYGIDIKNIK